MYVEAKLLSDGRDEHGGSDEPIRSSSRHCGLDGEAMILDDSNSTGPLLGTSIYANIYLSTCMSYVHLAQRIGALVYCSWENTETPASLWFAAI